MAENASVVVIGSGASGSSCARSLASAGFDVTLVEHDRWGGTCLWYGCIPKKALYHAARTARSVRAAEQFGTGCATIATDWQTVLAWKWHSQETYAGDQPTLLRDAGIKLAEGVARFISPDELEVAGTSLRPDHIVIATGSRPVIPPIEGAELADTSDTALRYPSLPRTLVIAGAGFIAMEMAGIFSSFGTRVTIVAPNQRALDSLDEDLARAAQAQLERLGVRFVLGARITGIRGSQGDLDITAQSENGEGATFTAERVLLATGRRPDFSLLDLDRSGVAVDDSGRLVLDEHLHTTNPKVWAVGDAAGGEMHTPIASLLGRSVAQSLRTGEPSVPDCDTAPITCFTVPQLATVGVTVAQAQAAGREVEVHLDRFDTLGAAVIGDDREGFVKLVTEASTKRIIGAQVAAENASDLIYAAAVAIRCAATIDQLRAVPGVHPSYAESVFRASWS